MVSDLGETHSESRDQSNLKEMIEKKIKIDEPLLVVLQARDSASITKELQQRGHAFTVDRHLESLDVWLVSMKITLDTLIATGIINFNMNMNNSKESGDATHNLTSSYEALETGVDNKKRKT